MHPALSIVFFTTASGAGFALLALLIAANLVSTVLECGAGQCDDNPVHYLLLR